MAAHSEPKLRYARPETNLYETISYDVSIENTNIVECQTLHSVENRSAPLQFNITGNDIECINLHESKLYLRCRIVDKAGNPFPYEADKTKSAYAPINNFLHSMFDSVDISFNEKSVVSFSTLYFFRAFIETIFGKGKAHNKTQGQIAGYYRASNETDLTDTSFVSRCKLADKGAVFELCGRPHLDTLQQNKFIPPGTDIKLTFARAADSFCIQTGGDNPPDQPQLQILEAKFIVYKHKILKELWDGLLKQWMGGKPFIYPIRDVQVKSYCLPVGTSIHYNETIVCGKLPDRLVLGLVDSKSVHGSYESNPLVFENFGLVTAEVSYHSDVITRINYEMDFDENRCVRAYSSVFENLGLADSDTGIEMTLDEFKSCRSLYVFDFRHLRSGPVTPKYGNCSIHLRFKSATKKGITVLTYLDHQSVLYLHSDRRVEVKDQ